MNQPNKFAAPESPVDTGEPKAARARGAYVLAGVILLQTFAMTMVAPLLFELVRTGVVSGFAGLGIVLAWALLLTGGIRLVVGRRRPRVIFAVSAVLGLALLSKMPVLVAVTGILVAAIAFGMSFLKPKAG